LPDAGNKWLPRREEKVNGFNVEVQSRKKGRDCSLMQVRVVEEDEKWK
jgi:hypothetical protein